MKYSIGTDIGGTFTDCALLFDDGRVITGKSPTTPQDRASGLIAAITDAAAKAGLGIDEALRGARTLVHGTTASSNALIERTGARVGLLTTAGHGEVLHVMRGGGRSTGLDVDDLLNIPQTHKPDPIVPRELIAEVTERVDCKGHEVVELNEADVHAGVQALLESGAESFAICFLWSFLDPRHEVAAAEIVQASVPGAFVACSHEIAPQLGEYYRCVSTVMSAYVGPLIGAYVTDIVDRAGAHGYTRPVLFAQSPGGMVPVKEVKRRPLVTLDSGPVSGVTAANFIGSVSGYPNIITADMGGTTFDVSVIAANKPRRRETTISGQYEMYLPMVDVESIGAGGGSIAWFNESSETIKVGPRSAGADPGPICYGKGGTEPTVTDADLVLGILSPNSFLGGRRTLDVDAAYAGLERLGQTVSLSAEETAAGILTIVDNMMADKIRRMTVYRGYDPREFAVFAFGGAGAAHAGAFARELEVPAVVIPVGNLSDPGLGNMAAVFSAMGSVCGDVVHIFDHPVRLFAPFDLAELSANLQRLEQQAVSQLMEEGFQESAIGLTHFVSMKYGAQVFHLDVEVGEIESSKHLVETFEQAYSDEYGEGAGYAAAGIEIVRQRVQAVGRLERPRVGALPDPQLDRAAETDGAIRQVGRRDVWWTELGGRVATPVHTDLTALAGNGEIVGPGIVELGDTTIAIRPGQRLEGDAFGNAVLRFTETSIADQGAQAVRSTND